MIYVTSDLHFGHNKEFLYKPRGFDKIEDHDMYIINMWNNTVNNDDTIYILGDLMLNVDKYVINRLSLLKGDIHYLIGNHDTDSKMDIYDELGFTFEGYSNVIEDGKWRFYLCHYPTMYNPNLSTKRKICLCGHTHTKDKFKDIVYGSYHVELDAHDNQLVSLEQIKQDVENYKNVVVLE